MNIIEWKRKSSNLRRLMRDLVPIRQPTSRDRRYAYNFSAVADRSTGLWHIYNCLSNNCIATVRFLGFTPQSLPEDCKVVIRYRPNSKYANILSEFRWGGDNIETIHAPTTSLARRSRWIRDQLKERTTAHYRAAISPQIAPTLMSPLSEQEVLNYQTVLRQRVIGRLRGSNGRFVSPPSFNEIRANQDFTELSTIDLTTIGFNSGVET